MNHITPLADVATVPPVLVNEINVTGLQLPIVLRAIAVAAWPKTLTFKVESSKGVEAEAGESEGGNSGGSEAHVVLRIRSPEAFRGEWAYRKSVV